MLAIHLGSVCLDNAARNRRKALSGHPNHRKITFDLARAWIKKAREYRLSR